MRASSAGTSAAAAKPASSQSVVPIVPSNANVSASAPASAARLQTNEAARATPKAAGRPSARTKIPPGQEERAGRGGRQPEREPERRAPGAGDQGQGQRSRGNERQEARGRAEPVHTPAVGPHRHAHDSHSCASSASVPACMQMPPRAPTPSRNRRYTRSQPGNNAESYCSECQRTAKPPPSSAAQSSSVPSPPQPAGR